MRLTEKQELFSIEYVMNGGDATAAYKKAYDTKTDRIATIYTAASKVLKVAKVSQRIHKLKMQRFGGKILSIKERKEILSSNGIQGDHKSIDVLNKMEGVYDAKDVEVDNSIKIQIERIEKKV